MKNRVSNAPVSLTRRYEAHLQSKRRGQALLLAVVVMLFVALISAGFLATVSGNLNQTARTSEKNSAIEAAKAGMAYINNRINTSAEGENWRPTFPATIPGNYYNQLAVAQSLVTNPPTYAKFPEGNDTSADAPKFYAKVERVGYNTTTKTINMAATDPDFAHAGMLKITVFGLAKNDPYAFHKMVAYRGGYEAAPIGRVMSSVSNYDFINKTVPLGIMDTGTTTSIALKDKVNGVFPKTNFAVSVSSPDLTSIQTAVVSTYDPNTRVLTFAAPLGTAPVANSRVEIAANIGAPSNIKYDLLTDQAVNLETADPSVSGSVSTIPESVRVNGSVYWQGNLKINALKSKNDAIANGIAPKTIEASGVMAAPSTVTAKDIDASITDTVPATTSLTTAVAQTGLIEDAKSRILGDITPTRQTKSFNPPDLASDANLARYRQLTRYSKSSSAVIPSGALVDGAANYGYGQGIYLDNFSDREKVYDGGVLREMTQAELMRMWLSAPTTTPASFERLGTAEPALPTDTADLNTFDSLEQQHLRGWVAPDEFHPRGALIELSNSFSGTQPTITITRDSRSDNRLGATTNAINPVADKEWKSQTGVAQDGVYQKTFVVPTSNEFNGVIFAEGNIRIKGNITNLQTSLTVVSMGNIYIEGSLGLDNNRKILLLARKNVIVNPTSVISRVDGFTKVSGATAAGVTLNVSDAGQFEMGDWIRIGTSTTPHRIAAVAKFGSPNVITLDTALTAAEAGAIASGDVVRAAGDIIDPTATVPYNDYARLTTYDGVLQRRVPIGVATTAQLAFRHGAELRKAATVNIAAGTNDAPPASATMSVKKALDVNDLINDVAATPSEKDIQIIHTDGTDTVNLTTATTLAGLAASLNSAHTGGKDWTYNIPRLDPTFDNVPPFMLTGIGNRKPAAKPATSTFPWLATLLPAPTTLENDLYVGTSVQATFPGTSTGNSELGAAASGVKNFGFAPTITQPEDVLTADSLFYSTNNATYNVDSRLISSITTAPVSTFGLKFNRVQDLTDPLNPVDYLSDVATAPNRIPGYNLLGMKLENVDATTNAILGAGQTWNINAFVYAQTGSWVIIPGEYFDNRIRHTAAGTYIDYNNNTVADPGEYFDADNSGTLTATDFVDLNRNGINDEGDVIARYARYNYAINFNGAIAENYKPIVETTGTGTTAVPGAVSDWMDKWSNYSTANGWKPITYTFDTSYVTGVLDADPTIDPTSVAYKSGPQAGFYMPVANDITYQE